MDQRLIISQISFLLFSLIMSVAGFAQTGIHSDPNSENGKAILFIPNAFTPNGDEFNAEFLPIFGSSFDSENYHLTVFNRWGETVFESHDAKIGWDGSYAGKIVSEGQYVWTIRYKHLDNDGYEILNGHLTVLK